MTAAGSAAEPGAAPSPDGYRFSSNRPEHTHAYLLPTLLDILKTVPPGATIFELGCGNGANAALLTGKGYMVVGIDPSPSGIAIAHRDFPGVRLEAGSSDEDLATRFGTFDVVLSLEVAEHVFAPKRYAEAIDELLNPGGIAIISTPYHSYLKNLALAASGKMDGHFTALWEGGHIKFWSRATLAALFARVGMKEVGFHRVGRLAAFAKSMVAVYRKPGAADV